MAGGGARLTPRTTVISENYFAPGECGATISGGLRFFGERLSADPGMVPRIAEGDCHGACFLPLVNFVYSFWRDRRSACRLGREGRRGSPAFFTFGGS